MQTLPDSSTMQDILRIIKKHHIRFPPPTDSLDSMPAHYDIMEKLVPIPDDIHRTAIHRVTRNEIPQYNVLRWADYWNENADAFFKFEIVVIRPNLISGTSLLSLSLILRPLR